MKINILLPTMATLLLVMSTSCSLVYTPNFIEATSTSASTSIRSSYNQAREQWKSKSIANYNITVDVSSSLLPPPCQMSATLIVIDNRLISAHELVTPIPLELPDNQLIQNPECSDYERYTIANQYDFVKEILENNLPYEILSLEFDPDYGYISHLVIATGEAYKEASFTDFNIR